MAVEGGEEGFWLPSDFDDFLMDKQTFLNKTESDSELRFPTEFPYDFGTRNEKLWMVARSPQSTLRSASSNGSTNGYFSTPTTPFAAKYDAVGDLIYLAAGEVAKLRLNQKALSLPPPPPTPSVYLNNHFHQNEGCGMFYTRQQPMYQNKMGQTAWTLNPTRGRYGGSGGGDGGAAAAKRKCAGTGVFLPRRYEGINNNNKAADSSDFQRKTGRAPIQVHTNNFANVNSFIQSEQQPQALINRAFVSDYRSMMARRQVLALQDRRSLLASLAEGSAMMGRDPYLPKGNSDISGLW